MAAARIRPAAAARVRAALVAAAAVRTSARAALDGGLITRAARPPRHSLPQVRFLKKNISHYFFLMLIFVSMVILASRYNFPLHL